MPPSLHIKAGAPSELWFELVGSDGAVIAATPCFRTICRLEDALSTFKVMLTSPAIAAVHHEDNRTAIRIEGSRRQIQFIGNLSDAAVTELLQLSPLTQVVDDRPEKRRRFEISGKLANLIQ
jgi:hypothetical protein